MSVRTYNPSVRVGNWNEDIQLEEDTLKDFLERKERGELSSQKRSKLQNLLFKPVQLSISRDGCVHVGDIVNIQCLGKQDRTQFTYDSPRKTCNLSVIPDGCKLLEMKKLEGPCKVTGSTDLASNLRNSFVIKSNIRAVGDTLRYGDTFNLCTMDNEGGELYLASDRATLQKSAPRSRHQDVTFVDQPSCLTEWKIVYYDPQMRMEYVGLPVPANATVLINHNQTNQNLAVEEAFNARTPFGSREFEISAHTYLDSHRAEEDVNHWMMVMGEPGREIYPNVNEDKS